MVANAILAVLNAVREISFSPEDSSLCQELDRKETLLQDSISTLVSSLKGGVLSECDTAIQKVSLSGNPFVSCC